MQRLIELIKYYEDAYSTTLKLIKASPDQVVAEHLFSAASYYKNKARGLRKELQSVKQ